MENIQQQATDTAPTSPDLFKGYNFIGKEELGKYLKEIFHSEMFDVCYNLSSMIFITFDYSDLLMHGDERSLDLHISLVSEHDCAEFMECMVQPVDEEIRNIILAAYKDINVTLDGEDDNGVISLITIDGFSTAAHYRFGKSFPMDVEDTVIFEQEQDKDSDELQLIWDRYVVVK